MLHAGWIAVPLGVLCLVLGLLHLVRLGLRRGEPVGELAHAVMGLGMAAMFVPDADPLPPTVWLTAFVLIGAWFGVAALRAGRFGGEPGHHLVGAAAMTFMLFAHGVGGGAGATGGGGHAHHGGAAAADGGAGTLAVTALCLLLAAYFGAHAVQHLTARTAAPVTSAPGRAALLERVRAHHVDPVLHVAMGGAMALMLLGMA